MSPKAKYVLGEVEHLRFCGAAWDYICEALNTNPEALSRLAYRNNRPDLAPPRNNKQKEN